MQLIEEFKLITKMDTSPVDMLGLNWEKIRGRIISKSKIEHKPAMVSLLTRVERDNIAEGGSKC